MESTIFKKAKLAAVIALASSTLTLTGCLVEGDESDSVSTSTTAPAPGNNHERVTAPKGTVVGTVQDTNGNPIVGATVYIGNKETKTNNGGTYQFDDIAVSQLSLTDNKDGYEGQAVQLVVVPPAGYLGATVTVLPSAVLDRGMQEIEVDGGKGDLDADIQLYTGTTNTFIDGFTANAGSAVLPALTATVSGTVFENENLSARLTGVKVALDMVGVNVLSSTRLKDSIVTSYQTLEYTAQINEEGQFIIENVPADSVLRLAVENHKIVSKEDAESKGTFVTTNNESVIEPIGLVNVTPIVAVDKNAPYIVSVDNIIALSVEEALLKDDVKNELVIRFSEALKSDQIDDINFDEANSVIVWDLDKKQQLGITSLDIADASLKITLAEDLEAGNSIEVSLLQADFMDLAELPNHLVDSKNPESKVGFDSEYQSYNGNTYVKVALKVFSADLLNTDQPVPAQTAKLNGQQKGLIEASNTVFNDIDLITEGIQHLNSNDKEDNTNVSTKVRLQALANALADTAGLDPVDIAVDVAHISFAPTTAAQYTIAVLNDKGEVANDAVVEFTQGVDSSKTTDLGEHVQQIAVDGSALNVEFTVAKVKPNYMVVVTPLNHLGYEGNAATVVLKDHVGPTTILQDAYGVLALDEGDTDSGSIVGRIYGDGGEQASTSTAKIGTPYLNLTPRLLGEVDGTETGPNNKVEQINTFVRLYELNTVNSSDTEIASKQPGEEYINPDDNVYDANAYTSYVSLDQFNRNIAVAFSEDVQLTGVPAFETAQETVAVDFTPENYLVENNVMKNDIGGINETTNDPYADLVRFDISNIYHFSRIENGSVLDFKNSVKDLAVEPNSATSNAKVIFRDMIPALVKRAVYMGDTLEIDFDKPVSIDEDDAIKLTLGSVDITLDDAEAFQLSEDSMKLTIHSAAWGGAEEMDFAAAFKLAQYDERNPESYALFGKNNEDANFDTSIAKHAKLDFSEVKSMNGVSWSQYNADKTKSYYFEKPMFAVESKIYDFKVENDAQIFGADDNKLLLSIKSTHRLELADLDLTNTEENKTLFDWDGGSIEEASEIKEVEISDSGKYSYMYSVTLTLDSPASAGETVVINPEGGLTAWLSGYDNDLEATVKAFELED